jgi:hypothetical protein
MKEIRLDKLPTEEAGAVTNNSDLCAGGALFDCRPGERTYPDRVIIYQISFAVLLATQQYFLLVGFTVEDGPNTAKPT